MADHNKTAPAPEERIKLSRSSLDFPVVGIGASAGGVNALLRFFETMPSNSGMAFVVVLHLSPTHESSAAEILQRATRMPVSQVAGPTPIEANHIYVIPPTHELSVNGGYLRLRKPRRGKGAQVTIDHFFRDLAVVHRERAIAIVLSGTGADGSVGLARLKEEGGITLAQAPEDAEYDGMPRAAIATGMVDFVLSVVEMPERLMNIWANAARIWMPKDADPKLKVKTSRDRASAQRAEDALQDIMAMLRDASRNDFLHYKRATVLRRIERRLQVRALPDLPSYRDYLQSHPEEVEPLLQDMLISVTNFFRDREAFEALERDVLPVMLRERMPDDGVRVWVAGCATGEEAYSLSILLREQIKEVPSAKDYQIFATDIDERAIGHARAALYPESIAADVTPGRLRQFFSWVHDQYQVAPLIREKVLFAAHNVLSDPPFSRLDLICCRNLLIYLDREAQVLILEMFRFALKPGGYLFLGTSESADATPNLFTVVDKKNRIYRANPHAYALRHLPVPTKVSRPSERIVVPQFQVRRDTPSRSFADIHLRYIGELSAPSVLIDDKHNVLHLSEDVGRFLVRSGGAPSLDLLANVQPELRIDLRTALFQSHQSGQTIETRGLEVPRDGGNGVVKLTVRTFRETADAPVLTLVMFQELPAQAQPDAAEGARDPAQELIINQLESEIRLLKTHLQETIEQSEASTEELRASNEELQSINEELRSATEELETAKEELQSINEELTTVNFELKTKVDEVGKINDDLQNMIVSADIATVFVDRGLHVKRFTPQASKIFNLIASDIDRPLLDITHNLDYGSLSQDVQEVFRNLNVIERQIHSSTGETYLARVRPYRTVDDRIAGAVLTFVDVTELRRAEEGVGSSVAEWLKVIAETTPDYAIFTVDEAGLISSWNVGAQHMFGYSQSEVMGQPYNLLFKPEDRRAGAAEAELRRAREQGRSADERWHLRKDGSIFYCSGTVTPVGSGVKGFAKIARDMTENMELQTSRDELLARELAANELKDQFLAVMSHELKHPLNLIQVNTELLISQPEVRALSNVGRAGETIRLAVASQAKIIDDLLDLSRARTGKLTLAMDAVDLKPVAASAVAAALDAAKEKGVGLKFYCDSAKIVSFCDRTRAEQIFWNLINNAVKFTPERGSVTVTLLTDGAFAKIMVSDTGRGIEAEFLPSVFGMFTQAPGQTAQANVGLGVGLALVHDMAVAQGGKVLAESGGPDKGSTFCVWLPLDKRFTPDVNGVKLAVGLLKGQRILVVDDMPDSLEPFAALLRLEGATADIAGGGEAALAKLEANPYDLIISDLGMNGMDGYQFMREVRKRPQFAHLRALALSGYGRKVDVERALQSGFDGHLSKPATVRQVCDVIAGLEREGSP